jgi:hypothetical protein
MRSRADTAPVQVVLALDVGHRDCGVGSEQRTHLLGLVVEGVRSTGVQIQSAQSVAGHVQLDGQHAVHAQAERAPGEGRPSLLGGHVGNQDHLVLVEGVQARTFACVVLGPVGRGHQITGERGGLDLTAPAYEHQAGVFGAGHRADRGGDAVQGVLQSLPMLYRPRHVTEQGRRAVLPGGTGVAAGRRRRARSTVAGLRRRWLVEIVEADPPHELGPPCRSSGRRLRRG